MDCPKCKQPMYIAEWDGWKWSCLFCDYVGRDATEDEVEELERNLYE